MVVEQNQESPKPVVVTNQKTEPIPQPNPPKEKEAQIHLEYSIREETPPSSPKQIETPPSSPKQIEIPPTSLKQTDTEAYELSIQLPLLPSPNAPPLQQPVVLEPSTPDPPKSFKIVSYNIRCDKDDSPHTWEERRGPVVQVLKDLHPDIVTLQESRVDYAIDISKDLGMIMLGVARSQGDEATPILCCKEFSCCDLNTFVMGDSGSQACPPASACFKESIFNEEYCTHVRIFTHAQLIHMKLGKVVHIINTHFPLKDYEQQICANLLKNFIDVLDEPVIFTADLNSHYTPHEKGTPLQTLLEVKDFKDTLEMEDIKTYAEGFTVARFDEQETHRLDYILFKDLVLVGSSVESPLYGYKEEMFRPSDHQPVVAEFRFKEL